MFISHDFITKFPISSSIFLSRTNSDVRILEYLMTGNFPEKVPGIFP